MGSLDILAVIRAPLEQYPPSINQVALLAEASLRVGVVDCHHGDFVPHLFRGSSAVERFRPCRHTQLYKEKLPNVFIRVWRHWAFQRGVARVLRQSKPKVVMAYDPNGMFGAGRLWEKHAPPKLVWHFHELCSSTAKPAKGLSERATEFSCRHAAEADLVIYSDAGRAEIFARQAELKAHPKVVMNCPRLLAKVPEDHLAAKLAGRGMAGRPTVYFHGWVGPSRCIEATIRSMRWWPKTSVFVIVGPVAESYRGALVALGCEVGVAERMLFLGSVPYVEALQLAAGATVGCSLVADQNDPNWTYSAGAINKRFEYMAVGLPQVANAGPGMREIIEERDCGVLADPTSPEAVGRTLAGLLEDSKLRRRMNENARKAHLSHFNYDYQFGSVLNQILSWCRNEKSGSGVARCK